VIDSHACPSCGAPVPETGVTSTVHSPGEGPDQQHTECPKCGTPLVRTLGVSSVAWKIDER
jgi:uncharacterized Zn finger protein (UPF0148 family)